MYQPNVMLVTGGAGFIGSNFIRYTQQTHPHLKIINLDKLTYAGSLHNLKDLPQPTQHEFIQGDICDESLVFSLLQQYQIDTIVHFAAESHVDRSIVSPYDFTHTNIVGTHTLLNSAKKYWLELQKRSKEQCRFHHISTDEVYGSLQVNDPAFTEETPYQPRSPYAASKAASDHLVQAYSHTYGLPITLSRCSNNYGPYQHTEKFIPTVIAACMKAQPIPIYGQGQNIRDWLYVEDHCSAIWAILQKGEIGEHYNIGGCNEWENLQLAKEICAALDQFYPGQNFHQYIRFVKDRQGHDFRYAINNQKIRSALGWHPQFSFKTGLNLTIKSYIDK